jgi:hypothetical protein
MVGATGFEPATSCSRSRRSTGLSYAPPNRRMIASSDAPGRTRTSNLLIRSQMLYPIELRAPTSRATAEAAHECMATHSSRVTAQSPKVPDARRTVKFSALDNSSYGWARSPSRVKLAVHSLTPLVSVRRTLWERAHRSSEFTFVSRATAKRKSRSDIRCGAWAVQDSNL